jgi:hypothetical protein
MLFTRTSKNSQQNLNDKFSIKELIEFERFCRDNAVWEEMKKCFAVNSLVTVSWFKGTGLEFIEASKKMKEYAVHKLNDTLVWVNGDRAVAITMATIQIRTDFGGYPVELQSDVKLMYRTQKSDDSWYIVSIDGIYEKDSLINCYPNNEISIPKEDFLKFRASYANLSYVLNKAGYKINMDLPGIDRPETVTRIYAEVEEWLTND